LLDAVFIERLQKRLPILSKLESVGSVGNPSRLDLSHEVSNRI
jgi:hypothetical protein